MDINFGIYYLKLWITCCNLSSQTYYKKHFFQLNVNETSDKLVNSWALC